MRRSVSALDMVSSFIMRFWAAGYDRPIQGASVSAGFGASLFVNRLAALAG